MTPLQWVQRNAFVNLIVDCLTSGLSNEKKYVGTNKDRENVTPWSAMSIFRFSSVIDKLLITLGISASIGNGICVPFLTIYLANITSSLINGGLSDSEVYDIICSNNTYYEGSREDYNGQMVGNVASLTKYVVIFATIKFTCSFIYVSCLNTAAENQVHRMRNSFFKAMLYQDIAWHDEKKSNNYATRFSEDLNKIQEGIGEKIGMFTSAVSSYVSAITCAFLHGWKFTLILAGIYPVTPISIWLLTRLQAKYGGAELNAKAETGGVAQEVFGAIRTVLAFEGQEKEIGRFKYHSHTAKKLAIKRGIVTACISAVAQGFPYFIFALGFWYGAKLVSVICENGGYTSLDIIIVFFCVLGGTTNISTIAPYTENFTRASRSAEFIFSVIDRSPTIDSSSLSGKVLSRTHGHISFSNVHFNYPSRPDVRVLKGVSFNVQPRQTVALVGASGSGKSTCIQLILRFFDPQKGSITLDGYRLQDLNVKWLRSQIGIVSQEPVLFAASIKDNIRYGRPDVTQEEIVLAAQQANAEEFILRLNDKYDTVVGERGARLSGGQKQRIAIARALVRNPAILLLDEATSALDNHNEHLVQRALESAGQGRTVIIVAHRLSTIRKADVIVVFKEGVVIESGDHCALIAKRGAYYRMISTQSKKRHSNRGRQSLRSQITKREDDKRNTNGFLHKDEDKLYQSNGILTRNQKGKSGHAVKQEEEQEARNTREPSWANILLILSKREIVYLFFGIVASVFIGFSNMALSNLLGRVLKIFVPSLGQNGMKSDQVALEYSYLFIAAGMFFALAAFLQTFLLTIAGESLTDHLRASAFRVIIKKEVAWFDREENKIGAICSRISSDTDRVQGGTGLRMGLVFQAIATILCCEIVSFYYQWKFGLLALAIAPLMGAIIYYQSKVVNATANLMNERSSEALSSEIIANIRTVSSIGCEDLFYDEYFQLQEESHRVILHNIWKRGIIFALASSLPQYSYAVSLLYGSTLIAGGLSFDKVIAIGHSLTYGLQAVSSAFEFTPNFFEAKLAANRILTLITDGNHEKIASSSSSPQLLSISNTQVNNCEQLDFMDVSFRYPTQPNKEALQNINLSVRAGKTIALVGSSGSGKSTCIQLILRFYDPDSGSIKLNSTVDARNLNVKNLRSILAFVSQEPTLFDKTIKENIEYGDNSREIQMTEVIEAARMANIHTFIQSLPHGYDTVVGSRGVQLSGGEKQRIAIARALIRKPKILLMDEATSALDNESEQVVQLALDTARKGRTCITVAHRLSTVRNADNIIVMNKGRICEQGSHDELSQLGGVYARLLLSSFDDDAKH